MKIYLIALCVLASVLTGCAHDSLKAPCNNYASFCGKKTKINHW
jgi:hypothetical protein